MTDNVIQSVSRMEGNSRSYEIYQVNQSREAADPSTAVNAASQPEKAKTAPPARPEKSEEKPPDASLPVTTSDILMKFNVDEKTHDITIYLIDRASKSIIRTIPANEVNKLKAGDLLRLLA